MHNGVDLAEEWLGFTEPTLRIIVPIMWHFVVCKPDHQTASTAKGSERRQQCLSPKKAVRHRCGIRAGVYPKILRPMEQDGIGFPPEFPEIPYRADLDAGFFK
jgi:hypothetical protein